MIMKEANQEQSLVVLIVDDVPENLAVLHDALDESGYTVLVANNGNAALDIAAEIQPDVILLDAVMPEIDGFQVCKKLKASNQTRHIPVIFMTGLTETEHVVAAFEAGGADYVTKPLRVNEVLVRMISHLQTSNEVRQARSALDAFGQAAIAITPEDGKIIWQTPLARDWMQDYFAGEYGLSASRELVTPAAILDWIKTATKIDEFTARLEPLTIIKNAKRLTLNPADLASDEQWMIVLREESDEAQIEALIHLFKLTKRESEVLYWTIKGKTSRDIGDILGSSPRTVNKHLEHVFVKLGVETRTAAASLAASKLRNLI
jgi:CheY-like chemotaxis protein/DNA-binding CsgD family transcriptional regulator